MIFKKQILFFISLFSVQFVIAQSGTTIKASVDKKRIFIGEPLQLIVEVYLTSETVKKSLGIDSIEHFEFLEKAIIDTTNKKGGLNITTVYKLTSFDSGHWVIPAFILSPLIKTDTIPIDVIFSDFDPNQDYHDIKDIIAVNPSKKKAGWWWYAAGATLLLLLLLLYLLRKKKPVPVSAPKNIMSPYEDAMKQLEQLEKNKPTPKQYHSTLTDIFRLYIFRKKGVMSLQKTTTDLVLQLRNLNLDKEHLDTLFQSLRLSDFVKFAKYVPTNEDDRSCFNEIKRSIITIEKSESFLPPLEGARGGSN